MKIQNYIIVLALVGCGSSTGHNPDYVRPLPQETSANFELWYNTALSDPFIDRLEAQWLDVQTCAGIAAPDTSYKVTIRYIPRVDMPVDTGVYNYKNKTILIDEFYFAPEWDYIVRHELIHHLLHITGHPVDQNADHAPSWVFNTCIYSDWATNNL